MCDVCAVFNLNYIHALKNLHSCEFYNMTTLFHFESWVGTEAFRYELCSTVWSLSFSLCARAVVCQYDMNLVQAGIFTSRIILSCRSSLAPVWQTQRVLQPHHSAWSNCITKIILITPPPWRFSLLSPLSTLLQHVLCWLARLPLVSSMFSFILQTVFLNSSKVLYPLKRMDRSILRPPTSTLNCWANPLNPAWGGSLLFPLDLSSSASLPPSLSHNPFRWHPGRGSFWLALLRLAHSPWSIPFLCLFTSLVWSSPMSLSFSSGRAILGACLASAAAHRGELADGRRKLRLPAAASL